MFKFLGKKSNNKEVREMYEIEEGIRLYELAVAEPTRMNVEIALDNILQLVSANELYQNDNVTRGEFFKRTQNLGALLSDIRKHELLNEQAKNLSPPPEFKDKTDKHDIAQSSEKIVNETNNHTLRNQQQINNLDTYSSNNLNNQQIYSIYFVPAIAHGAGSVPATQCGTGSMPATQRGAGDVLANTVSAGYYPASSYGAGSVPATFSGAGYMLATICGAGLIPATSYSSGSIPANINNKKLDRNVEKLSKFNRYNSTQLGNPSSDTGKMLYSNYLHKTKRKNQVIQYQNHRRFAKHKIFKLRKFRYQTMKCSRCSFRSHLIDTCYTNTEGKKNKIIE